MKRKKTWFAGLAVLALVLVAAGSVGSSMAYFTTYATARGGYTISYENVTTEIQEEYDRGQKTIAVANTGEADCFVRVRVMAGDAVGLTYTNASGKWSDGGDGYWYYSDILQPGGVTETLVAAITMPEELKQDLNVVVVEESTAVHYREDGAAYADWNGTLGEEAAAE